MKAVIIPLRRAPSFLLELHSERLIDAMHALEERGFKVTSVRGCTNRVRVEDAHDDTQQEENTR